MKTKIFIIALGLFAITHGTQAQLSCSANLSLMNSAAQNRQFAEAFSPWLAVFEECPDMNLAIYQRGVDILRWKLGQAAEQGDMDAYQEFFDLLMRVWDGRIEHFGDRPGFPPARVLGMKALDYQTFSQGDPLNRQAYEWMRESVEGMGDASDLEVVRQYVFLSAGIFRADPSHAEQFINDYLTAIGILDRRIANPDDPHAELLAQIRQELDIAFVQSGAGDCDTLDEIFAQEVADNLDNLEVLNRIMTFYRRMRCTEQEVFFTAALAAHRIEPTVASAVGNANRATRNREWNQAIAFLNEATELSDDNNERADLQLRIASIIFREFNNNVRARTHALRALEFNPNLGLAHILIGSMYAHTRNVFGDPVLDRTVFWVAVDRFNRAIQVDSNPDIVAEANRQIRAISPYFPTREEIFMHPVLNETGIGGTFTVEGWINERTTVRPATR